MSQPSLPEVFFDKAARVIAEYPSLVHSWTTGAAGKRVLTFPAQTPTGFDVRIEAETYGLYPYAGDWHGPPWELASADLRHEDICQDCLGFVRSLLCPDASLVISYSNARPFRWVLRYPTHGGLEFSETGLVLYNYFGRRSIRTFQNNQLPAREDLRDNPAA